MIIKYWNCQNGFGHPGHGTLKSALYQEGINGMNWFLDPDANQGKLKVTLIIIGWVWSKMRVL